MELVITVILYCTGCGMVMLRIFLETRILEILWNVKSSQIEGNGQWDCISQCRRWPVDFNQHCDDPLKRCTQHRIAHTWKVLRLRRYVINKINWRHLAVYFLPWRTRVSVACLPLSPHWPRCLPCLMVAVKHIFLKVAGYYFCTPSHNTSPENRHRHK